MSAAARARRLDENAQITVLEQGPYVSYANCGLPYYVGGEIEQEKSLLVQTPESLRASLNLDVRVNHEVTKIDPGAKNVTVEGPDGVEVLEYDALILAPGGNAFVPPMPGLDLPHVSTLRTVDDARRLRDQVNHAPADKKNAAVLGAGFIGVEAAEALAHQGYKVSLIELSDHVLPPLDKEMATLVEAELERLGITVLTGIAASEIEKDSVVLSDQRRVDADLVILSIGVRPNTKIIEDAGVKCERGSILIDQHGRTNLPGIWAAGDAVAWEAYPMDRKMPNQIRPTQLAGPANRAGRLVADDIFESATARPLPPAMGTAIVRVGSITAAMTGANRKTLENAEIPFHTIHLHPNQHAGYYPGATPIHLVVHFDPDGVILGAQAVGASGVDKRIDVLATAMRGKLYMADLIDLDLAYSPPYGMAKDPVNLAGMMGQNVLEGEMKLWYPNQLDEAKRTGYILDVRSPQEFANGHIEGAVNIPHTQIRANIERIRDEANGRTIYVTCQSGMRSYLAYRVLVQHGFDAYTLSGGWLTLQAALGSGT